MKGLFMIDMRASQIQGYYSAILMTVYTRSVDYKYCSCPEKNSIIEYSHGRACAAKTLCLRIAYNCGLYCRKEEEAPSLLYTKGKHHISLRAGIVTGCRARMIVEKIEFECSPNPRRWRRQSIYYT